MSIKSNGILVDSNLYSPTWQDTLYNQLWQCLIDNNVIKSLTDKGYKKDQYGECSNDAYTELFFWSSLIDYFILLKTEALKVNITTEEEVNTIIEGFNLDCFKEIARCRYNKVNIFNKLVEELGIAYDGLDYMIFDPTTPEITGNELTNDPTFTTGGIWYEAGHSPITRTGGFLIISDLSGANVSTDFILQIGRIYKVEITLDSIGFGSVQLYSGEPAGALLTITTPGTYTVVVTKTTSFDFFVLATTLFSGATISKFSVKEFVPSSEIITSGNDFIII
jgi:hypothetical protein